MMTALIIMSLALGALLALLHHRRAAASVVESQGEVVTDADVDSYVTGRHRREEEQPDPAAGAPPQA